MAGMFYSLQETTEKLNKTREEIEELIKNGRLREFRDGTNLLFKVNEVEALMSDTSVMASQQPSTEPQEQMDEEQILLEPEATEAPVAPATGDELTDTDIADVAGEPLSVADEIDIDSQLTDDTKTDISAETPLEEISLEPEPTELPSAADELTEADTIVTSEGTDVLGETDSEFKMADDMMGETKTGSGEASLEQIEEDVSLDTFGSGSGLLDLSLQADDTSLGGVLDEIYTSEGDEDQQPDKDSDIQAAAEAEQMLSEEVTPEPQAPVPTMTQAYIEPEPDTLSNALGIMLFLPLLAVVYTTIVTVAGFNNVMPAILEKMQGIIWYVVIALAVAAGLIVGIPFMLRGKAAKVDKKPKAKGTRKKVKQGSSPKPEGESS